MPETSSNARELIRRGTVDIIAESELELGPSEKLDERYKVGAKIRSQVIKLDELERKIGLSNKNLPA